MTDFCEIILVNDGSTDLSGEICKEYSQIDTRIKTIDQENQGAAVARNKGLLNARGEYVTFVDSDDRIASHSIEAVLSWINNYSCDVLLMQMHRFYPNGVIEDMGESLSRESIQGKNRCEVISYIASRPKYPGSACNKIYKRSFLRDNEVLFPEDGLFCEDLVFVRDVLLCAESFDLLECPYYEYRQFRAGSVTTTLINLKHFKATSRFIESTVQMLTTEQKPNDDVSKSAMSFVAYEYSVILWQYGYLKKAERKDSYRWLKRYVWVLNYSQNRKSKIIRSFVKIFGIGVTVTFLGLYMGCLRRLNR